jgi:hypothetical protein
MRQQEDDHGHCSQIQETKGSRCLKENEEGRHRCDEAGGGDWRSQGQAQGCGQEARRQEGGAKDSPQDDQRGRSQDDGAQGCKEGSRQEGNLRKEGRRQEARCEEAGGSGAATGSSLAGAPASETGSLADGWNLDRWYAAAAGADLLAFTRRAPAVVNSGGFGRVRRREERLGVRGLGTGNGGS